MFLKTVFNNIKNIINRNAKTADEPISSVEENIAESIPVQTEPVTYELQHGRNEITVNGKEIIVAAVIPNGKNIRLTVEPDGKIIIRNNGGYAVEFVTEESLDIVIAENKNPKFRLLSGGGHDRIVVNEGVVLDKIYGENGNDEIINNAIVYNVYGGSGNDTIVNNGIVGSVHSEDGDDTIINNGIVAKYIDVGDGDEHVTNNADVERYITEGNGNDKLVNNGAIGWSEVHGFENKSGEINGILYIDGEKYCGIYKDNLMYQDGVLLTGISPIDNKYYENGTEVSKN